MRSVSIQGETQEKVLATIAQSPLFRGLKPEHLPHVVAAALLIECDPGETLTRQGDASDTFFLLVSGEVAVLVGRRPDEMVEIVRLKPPASVGEVGLLLGQPRSATATVTEPARVLQFTSESFRLMFDKIPGFGLATSQWLAHRLQHASWRVPLPAFDLAKGAPDRKVLGLLPLEFIQRHRVLPLRSEGNAVSLGFVEDPSSQAMTGARQLLPGMEIRPVRIDLDTFNQLVRSQSGVWRSGPEAAEGRPDIEAAAPSGGSPRLDRLLERMIGEGASDLHLAAGRKPRWRVDGTIAEMTDAAPLAANEVLDLFAPVMAKRHRQQFEEEHDTDFGYSIPGVARFRVNLFRDSQGAGAALRLIPNQLLTIDQLGLPPVLKSLCDNPKGLILVTGPTGSGKSTTLAAMIDHINRTRDAHILTLEDPIEFVYKSELALINQREVGSHTTSFARALRAALREDPDIVLVGEMRDLETIALALETATTGHLVFGTLHTGSAVGTIDRIIDMFPAEQQNQIRGTLADTLTAVVSQTLCRRIGGGRVAALEVMVVSHGIANLIREAKTTQIPNMMLVGKQHGNYIMTEELARLVNKHVITEEEAMSATSEKSELHKRLHKAPPPTA